MKSKLRDRLTIGMALLAILLCGYGIGFLLGEKKGRRQATFIEIPAPNSEDKKEPWVQQTLTTFDNEIQFTPAQKELATREIEKTYDAIRKSRLSALRHYSSCIIDLHSQLLPHLNESQKEIITEQRDRLQETLDLGIQ